MKKLSLAPETILLAIAAFLLPLIGGHVAAVSVPLTSGILVEIFGGGALPLTARFLIALLIFGGLTLLLMKRRVIQIPNLRLGYLVLGLVIVLGLSILGSSFQFAAFREWQSWVLMVACMFLTVSAVGREKGWNVVAMALVAGVTILSLRGIYEFSSVMRNEPTYRIFAGWSNPNALASVLVAGSLLAMGLTAKAKGIDRILLTTCGAISVVGLVLTQSKGGLLAFGIGLIVLLIQIALTKQYKALGWSMMPFLVGLLLAIGLGQVATAQSESGQAFARVANASGSAEQSQGFRKNLWINAAKLGMSNPMGVGVGTYQYSSTKYGLTETTVLPTNRISNLRRKVARWLFFSLLGQVAGG
ncbi:MAG: O-antigen ligase family protein [Fimbriimonadaceae bacterium]